MLESIQAWLTIAVMVFIAALRVLPYRPKKTRVPGPPTRRNYGDKFANDVDGLIKASPTPPTSAAAPAHPPDPQT